MVTMSEPVLALLAALFGGAGLKIIETLLSRSARKEDLAKELREELRQESQSLKDQVREAQDSIDKWRSMYYALLASFNELMAAALNKGMQEEVRRIRKALDERIK